MTMRVAVLRFPGTWSETDFAHALQLVGAEADILWHADADLRGYDAAIVPGGFTYGDYLRAGAIAAISPAAGELRRADREGMPILGSCNGFQILCGSACCPARSCATVRASSAATGSTCGSRATARRSPVGCAARSFGCRSRARRGLLGRRRRHARADRGERAGGVPLHGRPRRGDDRCQPERKVPPTSPVWRTRMGTWSDSCRIPSAAARNCWAGPTAGACWRH